MAKEKEILRLNIGAFDEEWLLNYANMHFQLNASPAPWKDDLLHFLIDWLSESEIINAQTSGSTGIPKKIELQKKYMEVSAKATLDFLGVEPGATALLCLPISYIAAKMMLVRAFIGKMDLYCVPPSLNPVSPWTPYLDFAAFTPAQLGKLMETGTGMAFLKRINKIILGGGPVPQALEEKSQKLEAPIWHTYGMTETMSHIALRKINGTDRSDFFYPMPGVHIEKNTEECLVIDAQHLGVFNLVTNDIVELQADGGFSVLGRKDHVINSGGVKLFPEQIEHKLSTILSQPFFVGSLPDPNLGEKLVLFIESKIPKDSDIHKLQELIKTKLTGFEIPKEILFLEKFDRTESGKIIREQNPE
ncbi:MAG: AMP-binding protein [Bacteroidales bacterium]|nr:AMP-binding protein [Bacteroidales bacterium]